MTPSVALLQCGNPGPTFDHSLHWALIHLWKEARGHLDPFPHAGESVTVTMDNVGKTWIFRGDPLLCLVCCSSSDYHASWASLILGGLSFQYYSWFLLGELITQMGPVLYVHFIYLLWAEWEAKIITIEGSSITLRRKCEHSATAHFFYQMPFSAFKTAIPH